MSRSDAAGVPAEDVLIGAGSVLSRYAFALDAEDRDALTAVFTPGTRVDLGGETVSGRDDVVERLLTKADPSARRRHFVTTQVVTATDDGATVDAYLAFAIDPADGLVVGWGRYTGLVVDDHGVARLDALTVRIESRREV